MATHRAGRGLPLGSRRFLVLSSCVLIIDDDPDFRETFGEALKPADFDVVLAADGEEALAALEQHAVSLVITDMLMPGMDGIDVIHAIRQRNPGLKVIAVSGGGVSRATPSLTMASQTGADRVLRKPVGARRLVWLVRELLDAPPPAAGDLSLFAQSSRGRPRKTVQADVQRRAIWADASSAFTCCNSIAASLPRILAMSS